MNGIHQAILSIKMECAPEDWARELLHLLNGEHCTTADDRCVVLISLSEVLANQVRSLERRADTVTVLQGAFEGLMHRLTLVEAAAISRDTGLQEGLDALRKHTDTLYTSLDSEIDRIGARVEDLGETAAELEAKAHTHAPLSEFR